MATLDVGLGEKDLAVPGVPGVPDLRLRCAVPSDLPAVRALYTAIVADMRARGLDVWDDVYPCCALEGDVARGGLWVLEGGRRPVAAFALDGEHPGAGAVGWRDSQGSAVYLDRLGVDPACAGRGVGRAALAAACDRARGAGAAWLRLFVVDANKPAIRFYERCGCRRASGTFDERVAPDLVLREYAYELPLR